MPLHMCEHRDIPFKHVYTQVQTCLHTQTHLHTLAHPVYPYAKLHTYVYRWYPQSCPQLAYRTTITGSKAFTCASAHSVHRCTGSALLSMLSNHEFTGRPLVSSTIGLAQLPSPGSPSPSLMTGSSCSCKPNACLVFPPPGGSPDP